MQTGYNFIVLYLLSGLNDSLTVKIRKNSHFLLYVEIVKKLGIFDKCNSPYLGS